MINMFHSVLTYQLIEIQSLSNTASFNKIPILIYYLDALLGNYLIIYSPFEPLYIF